MVKIELIIIILFLTFKLFSQDIGEVNLCLTFNQETGKTTGEGTSFETGNIIWYFITYLTFNSNKRNFNFNAFRFILNKDKKPFNNTKISGVKGYPCVFGEISLDPGIYQIIILDEFKNIILGNSEYFIIKEATE